MDVRNIGPLQTILIWVGAVAIFCFGLVAQSFFGMKPTTVVHVPVTVKAPLNSYQQVTAALGRPDTDSTSNQQLAQLAQSVGASACAVYVSRRLIVCGG